MPARVKWSLNNIETGPFLILSFVQFRIQRVYLQTDSNISILIFSMRQTSILWLIITCSQLAGCLQPQSYGSQESAGYKAAYAKAREMRERRFAENGENGPKEAALEQTFQVLTE